jgi:uncharacterized phage protein (TIGR02218 family)
MKDASQDFIDNEEADQRKPVEIYHIWRDGGEHWRYTDGDVAVTYSGSSYTPATLERESVTYNNKLEVTTLTIKAAYIENPALEYIAINPVEILWISVLKLHRDDLTEADVVFIGQIKNVAFQGITASITCVGFEHFLKKTIPTWRYQLTCNHNVFDSKCSLTAASYAETTTVVLDANGVDLVSSAFGAYSDGYFTGGQVLFGVESRTIVYHVGNTITMMYKMVDLETNDSVTAYPGCDGRAETCRDKYDNIVNFLGFPFIPVENPALRVSW